MTSPPSTALPDNIATLLGHGEPWATIGAGGVRALLEQLAPTAVGQAHLRRFLADADATWITDADPRLPRQAQRLLRLLRDRGVPVALPVCAGCGAEQLLTQTLEDGSRVCNTCRDARRTRRCDGCDKVRLISRRIDGKSFCSTCRRQRPEAKETCIRCGHNRLVQNRTPNGPICPQCAPGKIEPCVHCGHQRRVRVRFLGGPTCEPCINIIRGTRRPCPRCGTVGLVASLSVDGTLACSTCTGVRSRFICGRTSTHAAVSMPRLRRRPPEPAAVNADSVASFDGRDSTVRGGGLELGVPSETTDLPLLRAGAFTRRRGSRTPASGRLSGCLCRRSSSRRGLRSCRQDSHSRRGSATHRVSSWA